MTAVPCRDCEESIVFLGDGRGRYVPVDADSVSPGDTEFEPRAGHVHHAETCPGPPAGRP